MLPAFVRLTLTLAAILIGLFVLVFVIKVLVIAALVAAVVMGGLVIAGLVRRRLRRNAPGSMVMTLTARR
jgi:hypothetical protein